MESSKINVLILAGGEGSRLWPLSQRTIPKQFLHFGDRLSLLQKTVERFLSCPFVNRILIVTNVDHQELIEQQISIFSSSHLIDVIPEPMRRNTTAAIALGLKYLEGKKLHKLPILVTPSDHILDSEGFLHALSKLIRQKHWIILFGIRPTRPETGYGYIKLGMSLGSSLYRVERFEEKPDRERAERYLESGEMYWNSGMLLFLPSLFWKEIELNAPEIYTKMQCDFPTLVDRFPELPKISIDYALLEHARNLAVCPLSIQWSDIGSWDSVYEVLEKDQDQNAIMGAITAIDTKNSLIIGHHRPICTIGLEDLLIIETEQAILISKKGESQKVKNLVELVAKQN